ncbi:MAG: hypothetical protein HXY30_04095 [Pseudorhodoplanes sp.]|nr:hypothetical protein [Pseudorhodoplanes sp.]
MAFNQGDRVRPSKGGFLMTVEWDRGGTVTCWYFDAADNLLKEQINAPDLVLVGTFGQAPNLQIGGGARLRSGGPLMSVQDLDEAFATCKRAKDITEQYPINMLMEAS